MENWLSRFELWARLEGKKAEDKADWCRLMIGPAAESTLHLVDMTSAYDTKERAGGAARCPTATAGGVA